ncbi:MAG: cyclodeaminase/cyclohydrolase family protein [Chloroflexi bacterium]|nr:cyclodeaminase/cyclohydrolase family protein [Chloroflexota bacterium]
MDVPIGEVVVSSWLEALAAGVPSPAGGSAAALAGAMAAALAEMVCRVTLARRRASSPAGVAPESDGDLPDALRAATRMRHELLQLATDDATAYESVVAAYRLPHNTPAERGTRAQAIQEAMQRATQTPLDMAKRAGALGTLFGFLAEQGVPPVAADITVGTLLAGAALRGAARIVEVNLRAIEDETFCSTIQEQLHDLLSVQEAHGKSSFVSSGPATDADP